MSLIASARSALLAPLKRVRQRWYEHHTKQVFERIYAEGRWGRGGDDGFCSGRGSHDQHVVEPYVAQVKAFLSGLETPPDAVDLGCGDFAVGSRVRPLCARYTACDIVRPLIDRNQQRFATLDVDFRVLDMLSEPWPAGQVVFIRQVLQHLSNRQIGSVLGKLNAYKYAIVTEHLPAHSDFEPNHDKAPGEFIRMQHTPKSGVVLHAAPFNLRAREVRTLCDVAFDGGRVVTTLYAFG